MNYKKKEREKKNFQTNEGELPLNLNLGNGAFF